MPVSLNSLTVKQKELYNKIKKKDWDQSGNDGFHTYTVSVIAHMPETADVEKIAELLGSLSTFNAHYLYICFGLVEWIKAKVTPEDLKSCPAPSLLAMAALGECMETIFEIDPSLVDFAGRGTFMTFAARNSSYQYVLRLLEKYPHMVLYQLHTGNHPLTIFAGRNAEMFFNLVSRYPELLAPNDLQNQWKYLNHFKMGTDMTGLFNFLVKYPAMVTYPCRFPRDTIACCVAQNQPNALISLLQKYPVLMTWNNKPMQAIATTLYQQNASKVLFDLLVSYPEIISYNEQTGLFLPDSGLLLPERASVFLLMARVAAEFEKRLTGDEQNNPSQQKAHAINGLKILVDNGVESAKYILQRHQIEYSSPVPELEKARLQKEEEQANLAREETKRKYQVPPVPVVRQTEQLAQSASVSVDPQQLLAEIARLKDVNQTQAHALETMSKTNYLLLEENQRLKSEAGLHEQKVKRTRTLEPETTDAGSGYNPGGSLFFNGAQASK